LIDNCRIPIRKFVSPTDRNYRQDEYRTHRSSRKEASGRILAVHYAGLGVAQRLLVLAGLAGREHRRDLAGVDLPDPWFSVRRHEIHPEDAWLVLKYLGLFTRELVKSNLDVARRVVSPEVRINPGIVEIKTRLKHPTYRLVLANSITLTPGTLTVDMMADTLMTLAVIFALFGSLFSIIRLVKGPTPIDRIIAIDVLTIVSITIVVLLAHFGGRFIYVDVAIVYGLLSFLGVLAVARYSEKGF